MKYFRVETYIFIIYWYLFLGFIRPGNHYF